MVQHHHSSVPEAYARLGLDEGASLDQVKSAYKKLAMTTHPDKNPHDPMATQKFQQLSEAYDTLVKNLDRASRPSPRSPFGFGAGRDYDDYDDDDDYYYDSDDDDDDDFFDLAFHLFLYEELLRGRASRFAGRQFHHQHPHSYPSPYPGGPYPGGSSYMRRPPSPPPESDEQRHARLKREREIREAEAAKLAREEAVRKARVQAEREAEMRAGAERRKKKASKKKAAAAQSQASAAQAAQTLRERTQAIRSEVFAAARRGDSARVKKGVWEESVDAAGPEQLGAGQKGETLLHIAAARGDIDLLEWLDKHNAEADERDAHGYTAFHIALDRTLTPVVDYFLEAYPPSQSESLSVYLPPPPGENLLELAMPDAQLVWAMLCSKLVTDKTLAREAVDAPGATGEIRSMLAEWAGFSLSEVESDDSSSSEATPETSVEPESPVVPPTPLEDAKQPQQPQAQHSRQPSQASEQKPAFVPRGRGRGRGRGQMRGRGAQRGRA
ncbi:DnaJ-domain-containing protein [Auricularia subglabra TFB-10046 SS5]|uniref:DnaJ-domain-containing protein n=1 Tax=Auricularia subglabra (strain TFB-10046 / SS5) TaxID=717982 RepID=J0CWH3_AURST|nr:DnaJ-domain-containing protein [Auricularia subglabra TFB-10046 SS5]